MIKTLKVFMMLALVAMMGSAFAVAAHAQDIKTPGPTIYTVINNDVYSVSTPAQSSSIIS